MTVFILKCFKCFVINEGMRLKGMNIYVFNLDQNNEKQIRDYIESYKSEVIDRFKQYISVNIIYSEGDLFRSMDKIVEKHNQKSPLLKSTSFLVELHNLIWKEEPVAKVVLIGSKLKTVYPWGDAYGTDITIVKNPIKYNIWHEISHLFGVDDHYDSDYSPKDSCKSDKCIMRYGIKGGKLCSKALDEMESYFMKIEK